MSGIPVLCGCFKLTVRKRIEVIADDEDEM